MPMFYKNSLCDRSGHGLTWTSLTENAAEQSQLWLIPTALELSKWSLVSLYIYIYDDRTICDILKLIDGQLKIRVTEPIIWIVVTVLVQAADHVNRLYRYFKIQGLGNIQTNCIYIYNLYTTVVHLQFTGT